MAQNTPTVLNRVLACMSDADMRKVRGDLEPVDLPARMQLERPNQEVSRVFFLDSGIASVVADGTGDSGLEVGMVGREGLTGLSVVLGTDRSPHETFMQTGGTGHAIAADRLRAHMEDSTSLRHCLLRYVHTYLVQVAQTCLSNRRGRLEARLARWLLMARDRLESDELSLTQELLAQMLGVRRPGVTVAIRLLEDEGLIRSERGRIFVVDRQGLEEASSGAYGVPEAEFERLFN